MQTAAATPSPKPNQVTPFAVIAVADVTVDEDRKTSGLIDVTTPGFFDGLANALLEAYAFLENR